MSQIRRTGVEPLLPKSMLADSTAVGKVPKSMLVKRLNWTIRISVNGGVDANLGIVESYLNRAVKCYHSTLTGGKICPAGDMTSGSNLFFKIGIHPHGISTHLFKTCRPLKAAFGHDYASLWKIVTTKSVEYYLTNRVME